MSDAADTGRRNRVGTRPAMAHALKSMPAAAPAGGGAVFAIALALAAWTIATLTRAGSNVPTNIPTTTIADAGPYRLKFVATKTADQLDLQALTRNSPPLRN